MHEESNGRAAVFPPFSFINEGLILVPMTKLSVKGYEIAPIHIRDSFGRRAVQFANKIISALGALGLTEDDIDIPIETMANRKLPASASWYYEGYHLHFSNNSCPKYVENLYIVLRVIELEIEALIAKRKTVEEFISDFAEDSDIKKQRLDARELLGVSLDCNDFSVIDKRYKILAKGCHPDTPNGDHEKFKLINNAHKILKRELG